LWYYPLLFDDERIVIKEFCNPCQKIPGKALLVWHFLYNGIEAAIQHCNFILYAKRCMGKEIVGSGQLGEGLG
jgi:hypothetical protein